MKRLSLILAVSMFAFVAGGAVAQTLPEDKRADSGPQAANRMAEDRAVADREEPEPTVTKEWLCEAPGLDPRMASSSAASSTPPQAQCAANYASAVNWCF